MSWPKLVVADAPQDAHPQSQLGRLAGKDAAGAAHLERIVADQLLSLAKARHDVAARHDQVDAHVAEGDHIVLSLARVAGHQVPALRTRPVPDCLVGIQIHDGREIVRRIGVQALGQRAM